MTGDRSTKAAMAGAAHSDAPFWDRWAARYARQPIKDQAAYETKLEITRELLGPDAHVVEIGCGTGSTALLHAPFVGRIEAFDVSANMIAIAREKAAAAGIDNVRFAVGAAESLDLAPGAADMVMAHSVLHLLPDRDAAIARAYAWLKPGGTFVSSTACLTDMVPWARFVAAPARLFGLFPPTLRYFSQAELAESIEGQGFVIERRFQPKPKTALFLVARKPA